jgi:hypothetical protein
VRGGFSAAKLRLMMASPSSRLVKNTMMESLERVSPVEIGGALLMGLAAHGAARSQNLAVMAF